MLQLRGVRTHNLKNISLDIPRNKLIVITGLSGSGKSSLAFDTIYAEGQRRYVESLSTYARQFLSVMEKPDADLIEGLSPAISIEQKSTSHNPRSTVGTVTEIYDYLRLLFARIGQPHCPEHNLPLMAQTVSQMVDHVLALPQVGHFMLLAPVIQGRKGEHLQLIDRLRSAGFIRVRIDGVVTDLGQVPKMDPKKKHVIEVVVDRFKIRQDIALRLAESFETAIQLSGGVAKIIAMDDHNADQSQQPSNNTEAIVFSSLFACHKCNYSLNELEPRIFSFNNPIGACPSCDGLGIEQFFDPTRIVQYEELSLPGGSIHGWDRRNAHCFQLIKSLSRHYKFDIDTRYCDLAPEIQKVILYGSGKEKIDFQYIRGRSKRTVTKQHSFAGVIPNMERRYRETDSVIVREGLAKYMSSHTCPSCSGSRLNLSARHVYINNYNLPDITAMTVQQAKNTLTKLKMVGQRAKISEKILKEIEDRLQFLIEVGLEYLSLNRSAGTLSGGEAQRIRLASQIGAGLVGVIYVLDEPSIGLHQRDNRRLLNTLKHLRDMGNTVIVVEHDEETILAADHVIDIGQGAGVHGGSIIAQGTAKTIKHCKDSITGQFLARKRKICIPEMTTPYNKNKILRIKGATGNNLKAIDAKFPIGLLTCVTGVSGSGKSTLVNDTVYRIVAHQLNASNVEIAPYQSAHGVEALDKVVNIDQSPIGRTPRSNPATYTGVFTPIRDLFAATAEARSRGYNLGRFSFNVKGGRCEACQGDGLIKVEMHFLPDIYVTCDVCEGKRYNRETLDIYYKNKNIYQILDMTIEDARNFFDPVPVIARKLQTLIDVGLAYIKLGQNATTLSGGEAQRVKLSRELSKRDTGKTLYILDEPTTGLHFHDIEQLLHVLQWLRDHGNTVIIIEHNLDVIKTADWIIDLGPEGGDGGGEIIGVGTPAEISENTKSYTGHYLKPIFSHRK
ncbi:Excinuclease ABC subunit A [uncultured Candidatus Thioglobus sp.]|nr:Excinuclease ABC subunit A [uncultured Candidatus Thioglobus sp.]